MAYISKKRSTIGSTGLEDRLLWKQNTYMGLGRDPPTDFELKEILDYYEVNKEAIEAFKG